VYSGRVAGFRAIVGLCHCSTNGGWVAVIQALGPMQNARRLGVGPDFPISKSTSRHYAELGQLRPAFQRAGVIVCGFGCSRTHRILSGNEPEGGVENVFGLTGRARHSGRGAPSLR
jgi:hypothetical protein